MKKILLLLPILALLFFAPVHAQLTLPDKSPSASFSQKVGFTTIRAVYNRPGAKGRKIFGELVPFDVMWRTGASDASKISFSDDVVIEGNKVPKGTYSLFTIPSRINWIIILNKDTAMHGADDYIEKRDLCRFTVKSDTASRFSESFTIEVGDLTATTGAVALRWENTEVKFRVQTDADEKVMEEIRKKLVKNKEDDAGLYYQSALYYFENGKDLKQALEWATKAVAKDERFNYLHLQAKLQAHAGDYTAAIASATRSKQIAAEKNNQNYVRLNEALIKEWEKLK